MAFEIQETAHEPVQNSNLSNHELSINELRQLQLGLEYSFIDKNNNQKTRLAANLETIAQKATN